MLARFAKDFALHSFTVSQPVAGGEGRLWLGIGETAFEQGVRWLILPVQSPTRLCASWGELYARLARQEC